MALIKKQKIIMFDVQILPDVRSKVVQLPTGHLAVRRSMTVTITCDHRHIYGADAAEFLKDLAGKTMQCNIM